MALFRCLCGAWRTEKPCSVCVAAGFRWMISTRCPTCSRPFTAFWPDGGEVLARAEAHEVSTGHETALLPAVRRWPDGSEVVI